MKEEPAKKAKKSPLLVILGVLVVVSLALGAFTVYDKYLKEDNNVPNEKEEEKPVVNPEGELDITSDEVTKLYANVDVAAIQKNKGASYLTDFYGGTKEVKDFNNELIVYLSLIYLNKQDIIPNCKGYGEFTTLPEQQISDIVKAIFGNNVEYKSASSSINDLAMSFMYTAGSKSYIITSAACDTDTKPDEYYDTKLVKAVKTETAIELYENAAYAKVASGIITYYDSNAENAKKLGTSKEIDLGNEAVPTYKYTFTKDGDSYYFAKVEKVEK